MKDYLYECLDNLKFNHTPDYVNKYFDEKFKFAYVINERYLKIDNSSDFTPNNKLYLKNYLNELIHSNKSHYEIIRDFDLKFDHKCTKYYVDKEVNNKSVKSHKYNSVKLHKPNPNTPWKYD